MKAADQRRQIAKQRDFPCRPSRLTARAWHSEISSALAFSAEAGHAPLVNYHEHETFLATNQAIGSSNLSGRAINLTS
jgi:hypothetical protein